MSVLWHLNLIFFVRCLFSIQKKRHRVVLLMFAGDLFGASVALPDLQVTFPLPDSRRLVNDGLNESFLLMSGTFQTGLKVILADFWEHNSQQQTTQTCKECNALTSWSPHYLAFGYKTVIEYWNSPGFILRNFISPKPSEPQCWNVAGQPSSFHFAKLFIDFHFLSSKWASLPNRIRFCSAGETCWRGGR